MMKGSAEANRMLLDKIHKDMMSEIIPQIKRAIAGGKKSKQELARVVVNACVRIATREIKHALMVVEGDTVEKRQEKSDRHKTITSQFIKFLASYVKKELPYLMALELARYSGHKITGVPRQQLDAVIEQVEKLKAEGIEKVSDLIKALDATTSLLQKQITPDHYRTVACSMRAASSRGLLLLGILMLGLFATCLPGAAGWIAIASMGLLSVGLFAVDDAPTLLSTTMSALADQEQQEIDQADYHMM